MEIKSNGINENHRIFLIYSFKNQQRPTAKELLKFQFIKKAKKNSYLIDLIDRYKKWKTQKGEESETESENSDSLVLKLVFFVVRTENCMEI